MICINQYYLQIIDLLTYHVYIYKNTIEYTCLVL